MISLLTAILQVLLRSWPILLIGLLTLALSIGAVKSIEHFQIETKIRPTLLRLILEMLAVSFLINLGLLASFITTFIKNRSPDVKEVKLKNLSSLAKNILIFFGKQDDIGYTTKELSEMFNTAFNQTQCAIDKLCHFKFLYNKQEYVDDHRYCLSINGRAFLNKHKLL